MRRRRRCDGRKEWRRGVAVVANSGGGSCGMGGTAASMGGRRQRQTVSPAMRSCLLRSAVCARAAAAWAMAVYAQRQGGGVWRQSIRVAASGGIRRSISDAGRPSWQPCMRSSPCLRRAKRHANTQSTGAASRTARVARAAAPPQPLVNRRSARRSAERRPPAQRPSVFACTTPTAGITAIVGHGGRAYQSALSTPLRLARRARVASRPPIRPAQMNRKSWLRACESRAILLSSFMRKCLEAFSAPWRHASTCPDPHVP
eukprot:78294-Prymnesium_polylepis.1